MTPDKAEHNGRSPTNGTDQDASDDQPGRARRWARKVAAPPRAVGRRIRRATHAQGAGESGLGKLIELHAVNSAGDMLVTVALASTIFFSVPTGEARGRVALYLAVTMAPFVLLAPVIGPLLDRLPHGRRAAMAAAMLVRVLLALAMTGLVDQEDLRLYPAALGVLVASKSYGVVRSAVVPRLLPRRISLVKANSRVTLSGLLATGLAAPLGVGLQQLGPRWPLYGAAVVFAAGAVLAFTLAPKVDSARGERRARLAEPHIPHLPHRAHGAGRAGRGDRPGLRNVGGSVLPALLANSSLRVLSGFLTFFLAFMLREHPLPGISAALALAVVGGAAGLGNAVGTALGAWLRDRGPEWIITTVLLVDLAAATVATVVFDLAPVVAVAASAGLCQALGKLSLDALIQRDVPQTVSTSAFARSETLLQMSWVVGGLVGISLPLVGPLGMAVGGAVVALGWLTTVRGLVSGARRGTGHPRVA